MPQRLLLPSLGHWRKRPQDRPVRPLPCQAAVDRRSARVMMVWAPPLPVLRSAQGWWPIVGRCSASVRALVRVLVRLPAWVHGAAVVGVCCVPRARGLARWGSGFLSLEVRRWRCCRSALSCCLTSFLRPSFVGSLGSFACCLLAAGGLVGRGHWGAGWCRRSSSKSFLHRRVQLSLIALVVIL